METTHNTFLSLVAKDLLERFGSDMHSVTVVFPSKRAGLFLTQELERLSDTPVWAPTYTTMGDLFQSLSTRLTADPIDAICTLYDIYLQHVGPDIAAQEGPEALARETLDRFWGWGEVILSDFDDIEKHLADADRIFKHVRELAELDGIDFLDDEQKQALVRFFSFFYTADDSLLRRRFLRLWDKMPAIYNELRRRLTEENYLWEGALYREAIDNIRLRPELLEQWQTVCFVGFNVLNNVEEKLMQALAPRSLFYWDYDRYYTDNPQQEAGEFMRRNLRLFPSALPAQHFDNLRHLSDVKFVSTMTDNATARYATSWLRQPLDKELPRNAIVLCNEHLLQPLLHSIPSDGTPGSPSEINITMGFPLSETPVYGLVTALYALQTEGWDERRKRFRLSYLQALRNHPYYDILGPERVESRCGEGQVALFAYLIECVEQVGMELAKEQTNDVYAQLYAESVFQTHRVLQKFQQRLLRPASPLSVSDITMRRLLRSVLAAVNIPFHGEPASGLQIMGVLETRCLDFSHLLMLSVEEDALPRPTVQNTMLPPLVREVYGLTTLRHKICIYAYYFYRLVQRAEHLTCVYNSNCTGVSRHEPSRFLLQLLAENTASELPIQKFQLQSLPSVQAASAITARASENATRRLKEKYTQFSAAPHVLSPTAINTFMRCRLQFYLKYVAEIRKQDEETDEVDASVLGNIFHDAAQILYEDITTRSGSQTVEAATLSTLREKGSKALRRYVDIAFDINVFHPLRLESEKRQRIRQLLSAGSLDVVYEGQAIIVRDVVLRYLRSLLYHDKAEAPFAMLGMELDCSHDFTVTTDEGNFTVRIGGRIDRLDRLADGTTRIVDYKTGRSSNTDTTLDAVFARGKLHPDYIFQTFLYALTLLRSGVCDGKGPVENVLFYVRDAYRDDYKPHIIVKDDANGREPTADFRQIADKFEQELQNVLAEIFSPHTTFCQTDEAEVCQKCDFCLLCGRKSREQA